ncbi:putative metal-dependent hydrolase [Pseudomonas chlororaphis subsp. aureofaciens]|uniref:M48 family metallopeptidase n=1 Tax=Pseudomonas chlororaphis TaxID=587753 RepID=UPI000F56C123|nr:SprT family zinc-dependent metalloprotease [Pseudomonas chlororaphis]AZD85467.1 putative metal-dependent hydrolase [Pseudomonas chlororaphis subsp. aureofaciens]
MSEHIQLGDIRVEVQRKNNKHAHLYVYPPEGRVHISAPLHMGLDALRAFAISRLSWIKAQQRQMRAQPRETEREYLNRESHQVWGRRYLLEVIEVDATPAVELKHSTLVLQIRPGSDEARRGALLESWYRQQLRAKLPVLLAKWQPLMGVNVRRILVQRMKTRWGGCNSNTGNIRLNTELAKKPPECLEYILVHELVHLVESTHNARFLALMDKFMPHWRQIKDELNRLPVRHEEWDH